MRRTIAAFVALTVVLTALGLAVAWPGVERRVLDTVRREVAGRVDADVAWDDADLDLVRPFPSIGVRLDGLTVTGRGRFQDVELASVRRVSLAIDPWSLFGDGPIVLRSVELSEPQVHVVVDAQGIANYDIVAASDGDAAAMRLDRVAVSGGHLLYEDDGASLFVEADGVDHRSRGDMDDRTVALDSETTMDALTVYRRGRAWVEQKPLSADLDVRYDRSSGRFDVRKADVVFGELPLEVLGAVWPVDGGYGTDVQLRASDDAFGPLLSLVPPAYARSLRDVDTSGKLALEGSARGTYAADRGVWPAFTLDLDVKEAAISRPGTPGISDIDGRVTVLHAQGPLANTRVEAPALRFSAGGERLEGSAFVADVFADPAVKARAKGSVDLGAVDRSLPKDDTTLAGNADVDLTVAGRWSDLVAQRSERIDVSGVVRAKDARYEGPAVAVPLEIDSGQLTLGPRSSRLENLKLRYGQSSDVVANGTLVGVVGYALGDGTLGGTVDFRSRRLDVSELVGERQRRGPGGPAIAQVPGDLDVTVRGEVDQAVWKQLAFDDVRGAVALSGGAAHLDRVRAGLQGGTVAVSGTYLAPTPQMADVDLDVRFAAMRVDDALQSFPSLGALVPYLASAEGGFDATMAIDTRLAADGRPLLETFTSKGTVKTRGIEAQPVFLGAVAQRLSNDRFRQMSLADTTLRYETRGGKLHVEPFDATIGGAAATVGGTVGLLDHSLDLDVGMDVPHEWIANSPLAAASPEGKPVALAVDVKGTWEAPRVGIDVKSTVEDVLEQQIRQRLPFPIPRG